MVRTHIQLTDEQARLLKLMSAERDVSVAELLRQAVQKFVGDGMKPDREMLIKRAKALAGMYRSGKKDISANHDKYLAEAFRK